MNRPISPSSFLVLVAIWCLAPVAAPATAPATVCPRCQWSPPATRTTRVVRQIGELQEALRNARPGLTVLLADGEYRLNAMLDVAVPDVVIRGESGDPSKVILRGAGLQERQVGVALSISAPRVTVADLTVGYVGYHGVQVRGERAASNVVLHNIRVVDTGQQLVKGSFGGNGLHADHGLVACSLFEYSDHAPSDYTDGIDVLGGRSWVVRDNRLVRIRGPREGRWSAGPAILFWKQSQDTLVERNVIVDSFRGIALGLTPPTDGSPDANNGVDHQRGIIRNNVICNLNDWADEGIEVNAAAGVTVEHNTVLVEGSLPWSISVRFPATSGQLLNNLTSRRITFRDGGNAESRANIATAARDWFIDSSGCDVRLARQGLAAIDAGVPIAGPNEDFDRRPRFVGRAPDAGAFEWGGK